MSQEKLLSPGMKWILLNMIRWCGMDVIASMALDMCKNLHQTILYLVRSEWKELRV